jgi:uncharacterized membrane protein YfcA
MDAMLQVVLGTAVGAVGTLVGTGGGWALVPLFMFVLEFTPQEAAATSLSVVFLNALSGTLAYVMQRRIQYRVALTFSVATIPGAILGTWISQFLHRESFSLVFGMFLLVVAGTLLAGRNWVSGRTHAQRQKLTAASVRLGAWVSALVGVASSILGVGGGIIHVPFLILVLGMEAHAATATSQFVLAVTSVTGTVFYAAEGHVRWAEAFAVGGGAVLGAQLGARLSEYLPARAIQRVLAVLLIVFALGLVFGPV